MMGQFLTAVLELRPSRRKAAAMERSRAAAEDLFWEVVGNQKSAADAVAAIAEPRTRLEAWRNAESVIARTILVASVKAGVPESVGQGLIRDVTMAVSSYVELRAAGHEAEWPAQTVVTEADHAAALDLFVTATTRADENEARDTLGRLAHIPGPRPMTIARSRDATLLRRSGHGSIVLALHILRASDPRSRQVDIAAGIDACTGEVTKAAKSATKLLIPVSCSKWHEQKFLSGRATLRSSLIVRRGERWFMCAQFEMAEATKQRLTGARLGVDRGVVNPVALAAVRQDGSVIATSEPLGSEVGKTIRSTEERRRAEQRRRGVVSRKHVRRLDNALHGLANRIVADAKTFGAQVVFEKLDGLKQAIVTKRPKGSRKGGWRKVMKAAQLGKLETIVAYKLKLAGMPVVRDVVAGGTSITCPACSVRDGKNRQTQAGFECVACGFNAHADTVAAVNVGRRDIAMKGIKKGGRLAPIEQDMVAQLRSRGDGGLGPLVAGLVAASGLVAVRVSAASAYDPILPGLTDAAGQKLCLCHPKSSQDDTPSGAVARSSVHKQRKGVPRQRVVQERLL